MRAVSAASTTGSGAVGPGLALALLPLTEAGVPIGIPADLLMFVVGERAAAGAIPVWLAVLGLQLAVMVGTATLFVAVRGPARATVLRVGPRIGLTEARIERAGQLVERRGPLGIATGRATPGLRTLTVLAAALSSLPAGRALAALIAGGTVFVQAHFVLGFALGNAASAALERARGPALVMLVIAAVAALVVSIRRRGRRTGSQAWTEAGCPACFAIAALVPADR